LTLAKQLGAMVFTYKGEDVADTLLRFAKEYRVGHIVIGRPTPKPFWKRFGKNKNTVKDLIKNAKAVTIIVLDTRKEEPLVTRLPLEVSEERAPVIIPPQTAAQAPDQLGLSRLLSARRVVIWDQTIHKEMVLRTLAETFEKGDGVDDVEALFGALMKREEQGSTFFNEGVAFPHIRSDGLTTPVIAIGLTKQGISDISTEKPVELVFLILSPARTPDTQIQILGRASRAAQNRHLLQSLRSIRTPQEAMKVIFDWEASNESRPSKLS
jgi:two-component system sensor histidine kinase KdpD